MELETLWLDKTLKALFLDSLPKQVSFLWHSCNTFWWKKSDDILNFEPDWVTLPRFVKMTIKTFNLIFFRDNTLKSVFIVKISSQISRWKEYSVCKSVSSFEVHIILAKSCRSMGWHQMLLTWVTRKQKIWILVSVLLFICWGTLGISWHCSSLPSSGLKNTRILALVDNAYIWMPFYCFPNNGACWDQIYVFLY